MTASKILEKHEFMENEYLSAEELFFDCGKKEYKGWLINLVIPNGGYLGVDIVPPDGDRVFCYLSEGRPDHDYHNEERLMAIAQSAIDEVGSNV